MYGLQKYVLTYIATAYYDVSRTTHLGGLAQASPSYTLFLSGSEFKLRCTLEAQLIGYAPNSNVL